MTTAPAANEYRHATGAGRDYDAAFEVAEWEAEQEVEDIEPCVYCGHPVAVEPLDEPVCDGCEQAEAEGRAEMYATLFGDALGSY